MQPVMMVGRSGRSCGSSLSLYAAAAAALRIPLALARPCCPPASPASAEQTVWPDEESPAATVPGAPFQSPGSSRLGPAE